MARSGFDYILILRAPTLKGKYLKNFLYLTLVECGKKWANEMVPLFCRVIDVEW